MSRCGSTAHMFKPQWKNFKVLLIDPGSKESDEVEVWALDKGQAGFLAFRKTRLESCFVEKVEEINKVAS